MGKSWESLHYRLIEALKPGSPGFHGTVAAFCRKVGYTRSGVDKWLSKETTPGLKALDKIAEALEKDAWELIKPLNAVEAPKHTPDDCLRVAMNPPAGKTTAFLTNEEKTLLADLRQLEPLQQKWFFREAVRLIAAARKQHEG